MGRFAPELPYRSGSGRDAVVNQMSNPVRRVGEFWSIRRGSGRKRGGYLRTPVPLSRNGESGGTAAPVPKPLAGAGYKETPRALALRVLRQLYGRGFPLLMVWLPKRNPLRNHRTGLIKPEIWPQNDVV